MGSVNWEHLLTEESAPPGEAEQRDRAAAEGGAAGPGQRRRPRRGQSAADRAGAGEVPGRVERQGPGQELRKPLKVEAAKPERLPGAKSLWRRREGPWGRQAARHPEPSWDEAEWHERAVGLESEPFLLIVGLLTNSKTQFSLLCNEGKSTSFTYLKGWPGRSGDVDVKGLF